MTSEITAMFSESLSQRAVRKKNCAESLEFDNISVWKCSQVKGLKIKIRYQFLESKYLAEISKMGINYVPIETTFEAHSREILLQKIQSEFRTAEFSMYIGVTNKKKFWNELTTRFEDIFTYNP